MTFLGHVVLEDGLSIDPSNIEVRNNLKMPEIVTGIRSLLGSANR